MTSKEAEIHLKNYQMYQQAIKNIDNRIDFIKKYDTGLNAVSFDRIPTSKTNKISDPVHDIAVERDITIKELEITKEWYKLITQAIDDTINQLNETDRQIVEGFIIENKPWYDVTYEVKIGERQCRRMKNNALERIAIALSGIGCPKDVR